MYGWLQAYILVASIFISIPMGDPEPSNVLQGQVGMTGSAA